MKQNRIALLILALFTLSACGDFAPQELGVRTASGTGNGAGNGNYPNPSSPAPGSDMASGCSSNPDNWVTSSYRQGPTRINEVNAAIAMVRKSRPDLFNGDYMNGECHAVADQLFPALAAAIRSLGICAWAGPDAIHPASTVPGIAEEYHIISYGNCRMNGANGNTYKGDWVIR